MKPFAILAFVLILCASCGSGGGSDADIHISGSSTVEPISSLVAEQFKSEHPEIGITVDGPGTGDGFELFCNGETDISDASRPIKPEEVEACDSNGVEYVELKIGIDGISVLTSVDNDSVECVDNEAMYALVGPESIGFTTWSDANNLADELGSIDTDLPDETLVITGPGEESGTYDTFVELVIEDIADERGEDAITRPDYTSSPNDNVIIEGIQSSPSSFGWVGYAFYQENTDVVSALAVADENGTCVDPTPETIASGEYPLSRPLFIYVNTERAATNPDVSEFVDHYLSDEGIAAVGEAGYVDLAAGELEATRVAWGQ